MLSQERVSLQRRIAERAILKTLQAKLDEVCMLEVAKQCSGCISSNGSRLALKLHAGNKIEARG